jgi:hypothetical protein
MKIPDVVLATAVILVSTSCGDNFDAQAEQENLVSAAQELYDAVTRQDFQAIGTHWRTTSKATSATAISAGF